MIAVTSISPIHKNKDIQLSAVKSWVDAGLNVYSLNCKEEIKVLKDKYQQVTFVETKRTMEQLYGKPYVSINAVLDWCKEMDEETFCIVNSDIQLTCDSNYINKLKLISERGIVIGNRVNYEDKFVGELYTSGIDIFFINKKHLHIYPQTSFCLGQCFWDYLIPYWAINKGLDVFRVMDKFAFHKNHEQQHSVEDWARNGNHFIWINKLADTDIKAMSNRIYNFIYNSCKII